MTSKVDGFGISESHGGPRKLTDFGISESHGWPRKSTDLASQKATDQSFLGHRSVNIPANRGTHGVGDFIKTMALEVDGFGNTVNLNGLGRLRMASEVDRFGYNDILSVLGRWRIWLLTIFWTASEDPRNARICGHCLKMKCGGTTKTTMADDHAAADDTSKPTASRGMNHHLIWNDILKI